MDVSVGQTHHNVSVFELKTGTFWTGPFAIHVSRWSLSTTQVVEVRRGAHDREFLRSLVDLCEMVHTAT
jgi:hypothetical protein